MKSGDIETSELLLFHLIVPRPQYSLGLVFYQKELRVRVRVKENHFTRPCDQNLVRFTNFYINDPTMF